jgi:hypothetical protein
LKPAHKFIVRPAPYGSSAKQFPHKESRGTAFAGAFLDTNFLHIVFYFLTGGYHPGSPVLGRPKLQHADIVALFPLAICLFAYITKLSRNDMGTL